MPPLVHVPGLAQTRVANDKRRSDFCGGLGRRVGVLLVVREAIGQFRVRALAVDGRREAEGRRRSRRKPFFGLCRSSKDGSRSSPRAGFALPRLPQVLRSVSRRPGLDWVVV